MSSYLSWFGYGGQSKGGQEAPVANNEAENVETHHQQATESPEVIKETKEGDQQKQPGSSENKTQQADSDTTSAKVVAKNVGSFLYGFATAAGKKLKESVDETLDKGIIGDFKRENEKFIKEKHAKDKEDAVPPWVGYHEEEQMKKQILALSSDERSFLRDPPTGVEFHFNLDSIMPVALATLKEDPNLTDMRFKLVPRKISEVHFWRNYFYRVSLIKQSSQLLSLSRGDSKSKSSSSLDKVEAVEKDSEGNEKETLKTKAKVSDDLLDNSPSTQEFVSDSFEHQGNEALSKEEMKQMGVGAEKQTSVSSSNQDVAEWEKELQAELNDFEFVSEDQAEGDDPDANWEKEIEDMLELEESQDKSQS